MKIATALFRFSLLATVAVTGSACVGYPVYSEPVDGVYYPAESPAYYPQPAYYPYPAYYSNDPSYVLWYNNDHHHGHGGHYDHDDHDRGHGRGHDDYDRDHGNNGHNRGTGYDQVRRDLCRDGRCDDRNDWNGRDDRNDNRSRKPPPVAFKPRPQDQVVAPRPGRVDNQRPQQFEQTGRSPYSKPAARAVEVQNQARNQAQNQAQNQAKIPVPQPQPREQRQNRRNNNDDDSARKNNDRDRQRRAQ